jgi:hypothetical protein
VEALRVTVADISENVPPYTQKEAEAYKERCAVVKNLHFEWRQIDLTGHIFWSEIFMSPQRLAIINFFGIA